MGSLLQNMRAYSNNYEEGYASLLPDAAFVHEKSFACSLGEGAVPNISFT
jgi:hypothetical protein